MKDLRIQPTQDGKAVLVDVVCDCGQNSLENDATGVESCQHKVLLGAGNPVTVLRCSCGNQYALQPEGDHLHVFTLQSKDPDDVPNVKVDKVSGKPATRMVLAFGGKVKISPPIWPSNKLEVQPGDLSEFAPSGSGAYGYQGKEVSKIFTAAPWEEPNGGVVFFDNAVRKEELFGMFRLLGVPENEKQYAVFASEAKEGEAGKAGYLTQLRIVPAFALRFMYNAINEREYDAYPKQELNILEMLHLFMQRESEYWGTSFMSSPKLGGLFGGDGDFEREELSFGFMVENNYYHIYRIWSRAWLVTK